MIRVKQLGIIPYNDVFMNMQTFTKNRTEECPDEIWTVQHPSVFTQGLAGKPEHVLIKNDIPIIQSDRGGQVTYHGPGQLVIYPLLNLKRHHLNIRHLVCLIEKSIISVLEKINIDAFQKNEAPGVYVGDAKIASLGLRIKRGFSYHGLALNIDMDLTPFKQINPCGLQSQAITQTSALSNASFQEIERLLVTELLLGLGHNMEIINTLLPSSH